MQKMCRIAASRQPMANMIKIKGLVEQIYLWIQIANEDVGPNIQVLLVRRSLVHSHLTIKDISGRGFLQEDNNKKVRSVFTGFPKSLIMFMIFIE